MGLSFILLIILLSVIVNSWPMFIVDSNSIIRKIDIPPEYTSIYKWLSEQDGDFRILILPMHYQFHVSWNPGGFERDIINPFYSSLPKPIIYEEDVSSNYLSQRFLNLLANIIFYNQNIYLGKILSIVNVKYIILFADATGTVFQDWQKPEAILSFLQLQDGLELINHQGNLYVFENHWFNPHIFPLLKGSLTIGSRNILLLLSNIENLNLNDSALFFADQFSSEKSIVDAFNYCSTILFYNKDFLDLTFSIVNKSYIIIPSNNVKNDVYDPKKSWVPSIFYPVLSDIYGTGESFSDNGFIFTEGNDTKIDIPFSEQTSQIYDFWVRTIYGPNQGELSVDYDSTSVVRYFKLNNDYFTGFHWVKLAAINVSKGNHKLTLINNGGETVIDQIALIPPKDLDLYSNSLSKNIQNTNKRIVYSFEPFRTPTEIFVPRAGKYLLATKISTNSDNEELMVKIDNASSIKVGSVKSNSQYRYAGPVDLNVGQHNLSVASVNKSAVEVNNLLIYSLSDDENNLEVYNLFNFNSQNISLNFSQVNPTKYTVQVNTDKPFFLIFSESYNSMWKASSGSQDITPLIVYSFLNGFYVNKTGKYDVLLEYSPQIYKEIGITISGIGFFAVISYLWIYPVCLNIHRKLKERTSIRNKISF